MSEENPVANPVEAPVANPVAVEAPAPNPVPASLPPAPNPIPVQPNPVEMQPVNVGIGEAGELVFQSRDHAALARVLGAMSDVRVIVPQPVVAPVVPEVIMAPPPPPPPLPPEEARVVIAAGKGEEDEEGLAAVKKPRKPRTPPPNPATDEKPFYAVFRDDKKKVVHVTSPRRLWTEVRQDVKTWIGKRGMTARMVTIYEGKRIAGHKGAKMVRARKAWHNEE